MLRSQRQAKGTLRLDQVHGYVATWVQTVVTLPANVLVVGTTFTDVEIGGSRGLHAPVYSI